MNFRRVTDTIIVWAFLAVLTVTYPLVWVLFKVKMWVERYADPTTHSAWVISNWSKFEANPQERIDHESKN